MKKIKMSEIDIKLIKSFNIDNNRYYFDEIAMSKFISVIINIKWIFKYIKALKIFLQNWHVKRNKCRPKENNFFYYLIIVFLYH